MDPLDDEKAKLVQSVLDEYSEQIEKKLPNLRKGKHKSVDRYILHLCMARNFFNNFCSGI